ncbi:hypothetical protein MD537_23655, partial [Flavihumibacter sediminis]|nr:hypothetical protein [Flavihumibacter sediminis]
EYPRFQKLILCSILLIVWIVLGDYGQLFQHITFVLLLLSVAYLLFLVWPYLPMAKQEVKTVATSDTDNQLSIYTCNVFQDNKDFARLINQVKQIKPDLIFL